MVSLPLGQMYQMEARSFDRQRAINFYFIVSESGTSKTKAALRSTAGYIDFCAIGGGPIRGGIESQGRAFFVSGDEFYEVFSDGTYILRGNLDTATSKCSFEENPTQVMIIDNLYGYIFNKATNVFTKITDVDFPTPSSLTFQDGYFIVSEADSSKFYISNINNGLVWDTLDYTTVEGSPDYLVAVKSDKSNLWCLGTKSIEVYRNTGNASFPFEKLSGAYIETGCAASNTIKIINNMLIFMGADENGNNIIWRTDGYNVVRLSTQAVEKRISEGRSFTDSYAWVYHEQGHAFYCLQVKGLDTTIVMDVSTGLFHERAFWNTGTGLFEQHRGACHVFAFNKHLIGDRETSNIYEMGLNYHSDNGNEMVRKVILPYIANGKALINHNSIELDMEVGVGLQSGQGSDPKVMMRYSDDGNTWSSELHASSGKIGEYNTRVIWRKLGTSRQRIYEFSISDPIFVQINGVYLNEP